MSHATTVITCLGEGFAFTPGAREEMRKSAELMSDPGFEGALYREQMAECGELMKSLALERLMECACPRMPLVLCS